MTERIRWHEEAAGNIAAFTGSAGTIDPDVFRIYPPDAAGAPWTLTSSLPGFGHYRTYGDGPDELKDDAERWLAGFVSSLGAVFPEDDTNPEAYKSQAPGCQCWDCQAARETPAPRAAGTETTDA
jgi:hypothetical protein